MPSITLASGYWDLTSQKTDRLRIHNMVIGQNPASPTGSTYRGRPGSVAYDTLGAGPTYRMFRQQGALGGAFLTASGGDLYVGALNVGFIGTTGVNFAASDDRVVVVASGQAWRTDGVNLNLIVMPDDVPGYEGFPAPVSSVRYINGFFLLSVLGTQRFYWIQPGQDNPDALDFASSERIPDYIISIALSGDEIWMLGGEGEEVFAVTTDTDAPFQSIIGRAYSAGCADIDSVSEVGTVLAWVSKQRTVVVAQGSPQPISDDAIAEILFDEASFKAWNFQLGGHSYYVLTTPSITLVFDFNPQKWYRWSSYERDAWRMIAGAQDGQTVIAGDSENGDLFQLRFDVNTDAGDFVIRELSGTVDVEGDPVPCFSVSIRTVVGYGGTLEIRWSDSQGKTFSQWREMPLGEIGDYARNTIIRSLGLMLSPGRTFVFRYSGDTPWRVDNASYNV